MKRLSLFLLLTLLCLQTHAQQGFRTRVLKDSLFIPWEILYGPDDHIWFTQKNGYICRMDTAGLHTDTLYHEPATITIKESGMLGMTLHPDFANQPYVYVIWEYMRPDSSIREHLVRYTYSAAGNTLSSPLVLLDSINGERFHNGSRVMIVGDKLFVSAADATNSANPQNLGSINGKILRLNLDGSIPADNPIPGSPIWTWGHRNPQGFVYANNIFYSSEHGPDNDDEINIIMKGRDYGWPNVEGYCDKPAEMVFCRDSDVVEPIHAWTPTIAPCGIDYYHHQMFPWLQNSLILTSLKDMHLYQLQLNDTYDAIISASIIQGFDFGRLRDVCISPEGKIFVSTSNSDPNDTGAKIDRIIELYNPEYKPALGSLLLYPNPSAGDVYISIPENYSKLTYTLYTYDGRRAMHGTLITGRPHISVNALPAGIYHMVIYTDKGAKYTGHILRS